ncbi:MAG: mycofactocin system FadH/OYE family oxidoreductase 2, partial [Acidimicrobiales bacterium]
TNYAEHGRPSARHVTYHEARARGGAGLIITEEHSVHPTDWPYEKMIHAFRDDVVPGYRAITDAVHRHGTPIFAQINHNGGQASSMYTRLPVWAPSPVPDPMFREVPKAVDSGEIAEIVAGYASVSDRCVTGGFDGIELQCSHSSIVRSFLSPATNRRTDRYGGSLAGRSRILHEIVAAVREAIGPEIALGVRLCGDELIDDGTTIDEAVAVAVELESRGQVDYINTSIGVATASLFVIEASMHVPPGYALFIPSAIRARVDLPVVGVGRFKDPLQADRAIAEGHCDLVGVVRGQIADPDFAAKARAGDAADIRLCLSCNQECVGRMGLNRWLGCVENPATGREAARTSAIPGPPARRDVMVIGAGPAGLQAAIAAAAGGHRVEVLERQPVAGGQIRWAASVPDRAELGDVVRNQLGECERAGVMIEYDREVTFELVRSRRPDVVIVATGSAPVRPGWAPPAEAAGGPEVCDVIDVLTGEAAPAGSVLLVDQLGFHQATSVAELLADRGCEVEVVTSAMVVGQDLGITLDMENWWMRATAKGITQTVDRIVTHLADGEVGLMHHPTGATGTRRPDWVVVAAPHRPTDRLYFELRARSEELGIEVHRVGDAVAPRRLHAAVIDGDGSGWRWERPGRAWQRGGRPG